MNKDSINKPISKPLTTVDDASDWIFCSYPPVYDPNYPNTLIQRFFYNIDNVDWHHTQRSIFHSSATDTQMRVVQKYFQDCFFYWIKAEIPNATHIDYEVHLFFYRDGIEIDKHVIIRIEIDELWDEHRITLIRFMDRKTWEILKTVFSVGSQGIHSP